MKGGKRTNKHKQVSGLSWKCVGGQIVYVFPFFHGEEGNKIPRRSQEKAGTVPGQSRENFVYVFSCLLVFFLALRVKGGGQKVRYVPRSQGKKLVGGISWDFCWDVLEFSQKFENKRFIFNFGPKSDTWYDCFTYSLLFFTYGWSLLLAKNWLGLVY